MNLAGGGLFPDFALFGEDASRIVLSCDPAKVSRIKELGDKHGIAAEVIGETIPDRLEISIDGYKAIASDLSVLSSAYESALQAALRADAQLVAAD